ncbi:MAG: 3-dehydroquinate synthase [Gammaproteobacteria bacterium]|nr:3-dehydroquinate synthase [Gammaproteobacteria bacterium]
MTSPTPALTVGLGDRSYPIYVGDGLLGDAALVGAVLGGPQGARKVAVVTNDIVGPLHAPRLQSAAAAARGAAAPPLLEIVLPDGERHKTLETVSRIIDALVANRFARDDLIVALGGGVVGDMAGFAAACYQRGIGFVQLPTTLLAQVDSSVGGKTGVNHPGGKNLIGAFHQPQAVVADTATLRTLPPRELRAGLAEVVKHALICDAELFAWLEANADALLGLEPAALTHAVRRCCAIKAGIVARDERETGERALLNLGHTFGHAIETVTGYGPWLHGEAVGVGLAMAAGMSQRAGWLPAADAARLDALLARLGLRTEARGSVTPDAARAAMRLDKKVRAGRVRLVLLKGIGQAFLSDDWPTDAFEATLQAHLS